MRRLIALCLLCLMLTIPLYAQDSTLTPYEIALQRIEEARESGATALDLSHLSLTALPPEIGQLINLQYLYLVQNQLTTLPPEIGQLSNLRVLALPSNQLTTLPPEIGQLNNLQVLLLDNNQLTSLPPETGQLSNLCMLYLADNNLHHLPTTIGNLRYLVHDEYELCSGMSGYSILLKNNPLISPPSEVVVQGTDAVLAYLRNQAWYHTQRLIIGAAGGVGLFALLVLGFLWKQRGGRKPKQKRDVVA